MFFKLLKNDSFRRILYFRRSIGRIFLKNLLQSSCVTRNWCFKMFEKEELKTMILAEHSFANSQRIVRWIGHEQARFDLLMQLFLENEYRVTQRAAMSISHFFDKNPDFFQNWLPKMVDFMKKKDAHDAVKRNVLRILQTINLPDELLGEIADCTFRFAADPNEPGAIRCFSMSVAWRICQKEPELSPELRHIIEENLPHATTAFKNRGGKILAEMKKMGV
jgi:hypothetical protein